jgi:hypothetical protein
MSTLTEIVAAVVVHSSAAAYSHFGVMLEPTQIEKLQPASERVVARSPRRIDKSEKVADCPQSQAARVLKT